MRNSLKILVTLFLSCFVLESHAIKVSVYGTILCSTHCWNWIWFKR